MLPKKVQIIIAKNKTLVNHTSKLNDDYKDRFIVTPTHMIGLHNGCLSSNVINERNQTVDLKQDRPRIRQTNRVRLNIEKRRMANLVKTNTVILCQ